MTAAAMLRKLSAFDVSAAVEAAADSEAFLQAVVRGNRAAWEKGERPAGGRIGRYASESYARKKASMNSKPGTGWVDLMLTHETEREMFAQSEGGVIEIASGSAVSPSLEEKYGETIYGIASKAPEIIKALRRGIIQEYEKKVFSK